MHRPNSQAFTMVMVAIYFMILAGCGGGDSSPTTPTPPTPTPTPPPAPEPTPPPAPVATSITVSPASHTIASIGGGVQLGATVRDQNNNPMTGQTVTWSSADTAVATVNGSGFVTAVENGTTQITARSGNASGTASITVDKAVATTIEIRPPSPTLDKIGGVIGLAAFVRDQRDFVLSGRTVTWTSADTTVATIDGDGIVTAVSNGMAEISAQVGDAKGTTVVTVSQVPASISIEVDDEATMLAKIGQTLQLGVVVNDGNDHPIADADVTWMSSDENVITVDGAGLVTAVGDGMAEVTAASGDVSAMVSITVMVPSEPVAAVVRVEPASHTLEAIGQTVQLAAAVLDQDENVMADAVVTWSSDDASVATVDEDGLVTAVGSGLAKITAQAGDAMGTATITVSQLPASISIEVDAEATTLAWIGQTLQLMAYVRDANDKPIVDPDVTWMSSDESVVTVDGDGLVEAVGNGMAEVTAASGDVMDMVSITVMVPSEPVATVVRVEPASHTLEAIGQTVQLAAAVLDQDENVMADAVVTWSSDDEFVATVDEDGLVTAVESGMAEITAQAGDAMGTATITVSQFPASISIEVDADATTLAEIGQTLQLMVYVLDANDKPIVDPDVIWMSSDESVVTVDGDGLVEAVGNGMADVAATAGDVSDMVSITVMLPDEGGDEVDEIMYVPWEGVRVAPGMLNLRSGSLTLPLKECITKNATIRFLAPPPPEGLKNWENMLTGDTLTVHFSAWQTRTDMDSPWNEIENTKVVYDACPYDPDVAGEYRLVGDITLNGEREFRASENTFVVE